MVLSNVNNLKQHTGHAANVTSSTPKHIVIIGAGVAGLKAASDLLAFSDHRVTIIEARDRLGGRLHFTSALDPSRPAPLDLGASWMHGHQDENDPAGGRREHEDEEPIANPLNALFKAAGSVMFDFYSRPPGMFAPDGSALPHTESQRWEARLWDLLDEVIVKSTKDHQWRVQVDPMVSLAAYMEERALKDERTMMRHVMETLAFTTGTEIERLSLREVRLEAPFPVRAFRSIF
jgi:choline dehydrogenase-like flavoprotein